MNQLEDKIAVITGGNSGIGLATATRFVEEGAYVFITGRRQEELDKAVKIIGKNVTAIQGDVSDLADLDRLFNQVRQQKGQIDILFANAGMVEFAPLEISTPEHFDKIFDLNTRGTYFTVQKSLTLLNDHASIILCGSVASHRGGSGWTTYAASKSALSSFARTWAIELAPRGIRANVISPGPTETPIMESAGKEAGDKMRDAFKAMIPLGRLGKPEEIAAAALFLASGESSFISGIDLPVDGGRLAK